MTDSTSDGRWRRRTWLGATGAALVGAAFGVHAWWSRDRGSAAPFGDALAVGVVLGRWTVVAVHPVHMGAVPVVLATADGDGRTATDEEQGLGAMALAEHLRGREAAGWAAPSLLTLHERATQYPEGAFGVPLS